MVGVGFEPTKAKPADLQSAPFDRFGTPPATDAGPNTPRLLLPEQTKPPTPRAAFPGELYKLISPQSSIKVRIGLFFGRLAVDRKAYGIWARIPISACISTRKMQ